MINRAALLLILLYSLRKKHAMFGKPHILSTCLINSYSQSDKQAEGNSISSYNSVSFYIQFKISFFIFCSVNLCQLNDYSRSLNTYNFALRLTFCLKTYIHRQKWGKMECHKIEPRATIKFLNKEGEKAKEI